MKRLWATIMAVSMLATTMVGCTKAPSGSTGSNASVGSDSSKDTMKIALSISTRDQWLSNLEGAATKAAKNLGAEFTTYDANNDVVTQISHVQTCSNNGYDAMIVNLVNTDNAQEMLDVAGDMKVVFVNRVPDESILKDNEVVYVGSNENESGKYQGEYIAEYLKSKGEAEANVVIMTGTLGMQAATLRTASAKKALEESGLTVNYVYEDTGDWDRAKAMEKFVQFMGSGKKYNAVICNNDEMALGVIEAMKTTGDKEIVCPVAGIDATGVALESIVSEDLAFTVFQNAVGQGEGAVEAAVKLVKGEECSKLNWVPFEPVDKVNVQDYMGANKN